MNDSSPAALPTPHYAKWIYPLLLVAVCIGIGFYAVQLNAKFYSTNQPFFDSVDYTSRLHNLMLSSRESGLGTAIRSACTSGTVCLPFIVGALLGTIAEPSRFIGIWIQIGELTLLAMSLYYYFTRIQLWPRFQAFLAVSPFLFMKCLYSFNGGLSDFRMDLTLMLLFSVTSTWYLIASATGKKLHYALLGLFCAMTCLSRATSPIYFIVALGPVAAFDLYFAKSFWTNAKGLAIAATITATGSLWFFILNYGYLHYYYVVWNVDANTHLPLSEAVAHYRYAFRHIGAAAFAFAIMFHGIQWLDRRMAGQLKSKTAEISKFASPNLRVLWIGLAPAGMLMLKGAGLNPFVCMPSTYGLLLFALIPTTAVKLQNSSRIAAVVLLLCASLATTYNFKFGWNNHIGDAPQSMQAHRQAINAILRDAHNLQLSEATYTTTQVAYFNLNSIQNVAMFDMPESDCTSNFVSVAGVKLVPDHSFSIVAPAEWNVAKGDTDQEKLANLVENAGSNVVYLAIPTLEASQFLQEHISHNLINRYAIEIRERLLETGNWEDISGDIRNNSNEVVRIYRNRSLSSKLAADSNKTGNPKSDFEIARVQSAKDQVELK